MLDEILRDARQGAAGFGPPVRSCPRDAESPPSVGTARVIPYFALNGGTVDLMPALLAMLGYDVTPATRDDLKKHPATLVNCHGANSDNSAGWERWSGKLVALSGNDADSRRVSLPCSVGQLRALAAQVGQRCAARTSVEPGPFLPTDWGRRPTRPRPETGRFRGRRAGRRPTPYPTVQSKPRRRPNWSGSAHRDWLCSPAVREERFERLLGIRCRGDGAPT